MESIEQEKVSSSGGATGQITLQRAIALGVYKPGDLSKFPDWHVLSAHGQLQLIREGIRNHKSQLLSQYAAIFNTLDFSLKKDTLESKMNHVLELVKQVDRDEEHYLTTYV